jgi:cytoskeletal protein CcmA (bactofilin family)
MWSKRRDERPVNKPPDSTASSAHSPLDVKKETTTMSSLQNPALDAEARGASSATIGKAVKIVGQIHSKEDLYVDGDVDGSVEALEHKVTVGPNGTMNAMIQAREVIVLGTIRGNVEASDRVEIRKEANLVGYIRTMRITIEDGAYFKGSIDIIKREPAARQAHAAQAAFSTPR